MAENQNRRLTPPGEKTLNKQAASLAAPPDSWTGKMAQAATQDQQPQQPQQRRQQAPQQPVKEYPEPEAPGFTEALGDVGNAAMIGGGQLAGGAGYLADMVGAEDTAKSLRSLSDEAQEYWGEGLSGEAKYALQRMGKGDISGYGTLIAGAQSALPSAAGMGAGGVAAKGLQGLGAGTTAARTIGFSAGESGTQAPTAAEETRKQVMERPHDDLLKNSEEYKRLYQENVRQGLPEDQAREGAKEVVADAAGRRTLGYAGATTAALSAPFGGALGRLAAGVPGSNRAANTAKGAVTEGAQEAVQEPAQQASQNLAIQQTADETQAVTEGLGASALAGGAVGGAMGAGFGTFSPTGQPQGQQPDPSDPRSNAFSRQPRPLTGPGQKQQSRQEQPEGAQPDLQQPQVPSFGAFKQGAQEQEQANYATRGDMPREAKVPPYSAFAQAAQEQQGAGYAARAEGPMTGATKGLTPPPGQDQQQGERKERLGTTGVQPGGEFIPAGQQQGQEPAGNVEQEPIEGRSWPARPDFSDLRPGGKPNEATQDMAERFGRGEKPDQPGLPEPPQARQKEGEGGPERQINMGKHGKRNVQFPNRFSDQVFEVSDEVRKGKKDSKASQDQIDQTFQGLRDAGVDTDNLTQADLGEYAKRVREAAQQQPKDKKVQIDTPATDIMERVANDRRRKKAAQDEYARKSPEEVVQDRNTDGKDPSELSGEELRSAAAGVVGPTEVERVRQLTDDEQRAIVQRGMRGQVEDSIANQGVSGDETRANPAKNTHRRKVEQALKRGEDVPFKAARHYPTLREKYTRQIKGSDPGQPDWMTETEEEQALVQEADRKLAEEPDQERGEVPQTLSEVEPSEDQIQEAYDRKVQKGAFNTADYAETPTELRQEADQALGRTEAAKNKGISEEKFDRFTDRQKQNFADTRRKQRAQGYAAERLAGERPEPKFNVGDRVQIPQGTPGEVTGLEFSPDGESSYQLTVTPDEGEQTTLPEASLAPEGGEQITEPEGEPEGQEQPEGEGQQGAEEGPDYGEELAITTGGKRAKPSLDRPAYQHTEQELADASRNSGPVAADPTSIRQFEEARKEIVQEAYEQGKDVPSRVLAELPGAVRNDLSPDDEDLMVDDTAEISDPDQKVRAMEQWDPDNRDPLGFNQGEEQQEGQEDEGTERGEPGEGDQQGEEGVGEGGEEPGRTGPEGVEGGTPEQTPSYQGHGLSQAAQDQLDLVLSELPPAARNFVELASDRGRPIIFRQRTEEELDSMPPDMRERLRLAKAVTWNKMRIELMDDHFDREVIQHELAHMAYERISNPAKDKAKEMAADDGERIVKTARAKKNIPEDLQSQEGELERKHVAQQSRRLKKRDAKSLWQSIELDMAVGNNAAADIAEAIGLDITDDQYVSLALGEWAARENGLELDMGEMREEELAYRAGLNDEYANDIFSEAADELRSLLQKEGGQPQQEEQPGEEQQEGQSQEGEGQEQADPAWYDTWEPEWKEDRTRGGGVRHLQNPGPLVDNVKVGRDSKTGKWDVSGQLEDGSMLLRTGHDQMQEAMEKARYEILRRVRPEALEQEAEPESEPEEGKALSEEPSQEEIERELNRLQTGDDLSPPDISRASMATSYPVKEGERKYEAYRRAAKQFLEGDLDRKVVRKETNKISSGALVAGGYFPVTPEARKISKAKVAKDFDGTFKELARMKGKEDPRYYLNGVKIEPERGRMVATDGERIAILEQAPVSDQQGRILLEDGGSFDSKDYPDYNRVLPDIDESQDGLDVAVEDWLPYLNGVSRARKFVREKTKAVRVQTGESVETAAFVDSEYIREALEATRRLGYDQINIKAASNRYFYAETFDGRLKHLIMPLRAGDEEINSKEGFWGTMQSDGVAQEAKNQFETKQQDEEVPPDQEGDGGQGPREETQGERLARLRREQREQQEGEPEGGEEGQTDQEAEPEGEPEVEPEGGTKGKPDDFGQRLEGAKKHEADKYKEQIEEIESVEDVMKASLSQAFPKPNLNKLHKEGAPLEELAAVSLLRDSVGKKPGGKGRSAEIDRRRWADHLTDAKGLADQILYGDLDSSEAALNRVLEADSGFSRPNDLIEALRAAPLVSRAVEVAGWSAETVDTISDMRLAKKTDGRLRTSTEGELVDLSEDQPGYNLKTSYQSKKKPGGSLFRTTSMSEIWNGGLEAVQYMASSRSEEAQKTKYTPVEVRYYKNTGEGLLTWRPKGRIEILMRGFENTKAARDYLANHRDEVQAEIDRIRQEPKVRGTENRKRQGEARRQDHVTNDDYNEAFGFRGVQFGRSMSNSRRQQDMDEAYDAFMDMADTIDIPTQAISLSGRLGMAFGARGKGGKNPAAAHYEPDQVVINLTQTGGPGTLGHEWFHALDNYFAGKWESNTGFASGTAPDPEKFIPGEADKYGDRVRPVMLEAWKRLRDALHASDYYKRARELDQDKNRTYWAAPHEMAARAYEKYLVDRLAEQGITNDFLANIETGSGAFPTDEEMAGGIRAAFDNLFQTMESQVTEDGTVLYAQVGNDTSDQVFAQTPDQVIEELRGAWGGKAVDGLLRNQAIQVVPSQRDLPGHIQQTGGTIRGAHDTVTGASYLVANNIEPGMAAGALAHEVGAHYGLRQMLGDKKFNEVLDQVNRMVANGNEAAIRARDQVPENVGTRNIPEETLANLVEARANKGLSVVRKVTAGIRAFLNRMGLVQNLNADDIAVMAKAAVRRVSRGQTIQRAPGVGAQAEGRVRYSQVDQGSATPVDTKSEQFQAWFDDSKIVDEEGNPKVVYHGTAADIEQFADVALGQNTGVQSTNLGFFFTDSPGEGRRTAGRYGADVWAGNELGDYREGANIAPTYLTIRNPKTLRGKELIRAFLDGDANNVRAEAEAAGHDGFVVPGDEESWYIPFKPEQIKSATGNTGAFDPTDPRIQHSVEEGQQAGLSDQAFNDEINRITQNWEWAKNRMNALRSAEEAPQHIADSVRKANEAGYRNPGLVNNGRIYLFQDQIESTEELESLLFHEATHLAMRERMGGNEEVTKFFAGLVNKMGGAGEVFQIAREHGVNLEHYAKQGQPGQDEADKMVQRARMADELLAEINGNIPHENLSGRAQRAIREFLGKVRDWARRRGLTALANRIGMDLERPSEADLSYMAGQAREWMTEEGGNRLYQTPQGTNLDQNTGVAESDIAPAIRPNASETEQNKHDFLKDIGRVASKAPKQGEVTDFVRDNLSRMRSGALDLLTLDQLDNVGRGQFQTTTGGGINALTHFRKTVDRFQETRNQDVAEASRIRERWNKFMKQDREASDTLADMMNRATVAEIHPDQDLEQQQHYLDMQEELERKREQIAKYEEELASGKLPEWQEPSLEVGLAEMRERAEELEHNLAEAPRLRELWKSLPEEAKGTDEEKGIYQEVRDQYENHYNKVMEALEKRVRETAADEKVAKETIDQIHQQFMQAKQEGPYFPLHRFGDYWIQVDQGEGRKPLFEMVESPGQQTRRMRELKQQGYTGDAITHGKMGQHFPDLEGVPDSFMGDIVSQIEATAKDSQERDALRDAAYQLYLKHLPDLSYKKQFIHRKKSPGYSGDVARGFAQQMFHGAYQLARLQHTHKLKQDLDDLQGQVDQQEVADPVAAQEVVDRAKKQYEYIQNPGGNPWVQKATSLGFVWYLGATPAAAIVNMTQTPLMGIPNIGAVHGMAKTSKELFGRGTKDYTRIIRNVDTKTGNFELPQDMKDEVSYGEELEQALREFRDEGGIDLTLSADLAGQGQNPSEVYNEKWQKAMGYTSFMFHEAERYNRIVTFTSAYRLHREAGYDHGKAYEFAHNMTYASHFNYCVDTATECLTTAGWKAYDQVQEGDIALAVDENGNTVESRIESVNVFQGQHEVIEHKSGQSRFSMVVTPNHDALIRSYNSKKKSWGRIRKTPASELRDSHFLLRAPLGGIERAGGEYGEDFAALLGWVAAEGNYARNRGCHEQRNVRLHQSHRHNPGYVEEIQGVLDRMGAGYSRHAVNDGTITLWALNDDLGPQIQAEMPDKALTFRMVERMNTSEMEAVIDAFCKGDGTLNPSGGWTVCQKNGIGRQNLEVLQAMATSCGMVATLQDKGYESELILAAAGHNTHVRPLAKERKTVDTVWCPTTEHGTWIARRDGAVFTTGNSNVNRATIMQPSLSRVPFMFMQYSQNMIYQIGRNLQQSMAGEDKETRRLAQKRFAGIMGMHALMAGAFGLPAASLFAASMDAITSMFSGEDDDDYFDAKTEFQNFLAEYLGTTTSTAITHGLPRALTPVDMHSRISLDGLLFRQPAQDLQGEDWARYSLEQLAGPLYAAGKDFLGGVHSIASEGRLMRGMEDMTPKFISDALTAVRWTDEGVRNFRKDLIVDNVTPAEVIGQAMGFTPSRVSEHYDAYFALDNAQKRIERRRDTLLNKYWLGLRNNDNDMRKETLDQIKRFNEKYPQVGITGKTISSSMESRYQHTAEAKMGIHIKESLRPMLLEDLKAYELED